MRLKSEGVDRFPLLSARSKNAILASLASPALRRRASSGSAPHWGLLAWWGPPQSPPSQSWSGQANQGSQCPSPRQSWQER